MLERKEKRRAKKNIENNRREGRGTLQNKKEKIKKRNDKTDCKKKTDNRFASMKERGKRKRKIMSD